MNTSLVTLLLLDLGLIAALPRVFFRRGKLNLSWWLTATPFFAAACLVVASATGLVETRALEGALQTMLEVGATLLAGASIALLALTLGTHRRRISLWHQRDDAPEAIVTEGPYARIRHPFYASFLIALCAVALAVPHVSSLLILVYAFSALSLTAAREERRLCSSAFGEEYRAYMEQAGRFHPRLRGGQR